MSQENTEIVEAAWRSWQHGGLEAFAGYWGDGIDWQATGGHWRGREAGLAYLQAWLDLFDEFKPEPIEVIDAGGDQVVTLVRYSGREKRSGIQVPSEYFAVVNEIHNGKIVSGHEYATLEDALQAVGLSEQDAHSS